MVSVVGGFFIMLKKYKIATIFVVFVTSVSSAERDV